MSNNYPPGVTGNEYEIAGPDYEIEREEECKDCGQTFIQFVEGYHGREWFTCSLCSAYNEIEPEIDDTDYHEHEMICCECGEKHCCCKCPVFS